jgi:hypothetical protein
MILRFTEAETLIMGSFSNFCYLIRAGKVSKLILALYKVMSLMELVV